MESEIKEVKGLGRFYNKDSRTFRKREWKGFKDTMYDYGRWLKLYGYMTVRLGAHPILMIKALKRYRWMVSFLTASNMIDKHTLGLRGKELRYAHEQFFFFSA